MTTSIWTPTARTTADHSKATVAKCAMSATAPVARWRSRLGLGLLIALGLAGLIRFVEPEATVSGADHQYLELVSDEELLAVREQLAARQAEIRSRIDYKEGLMLELTQRRLSIFEVAEEFLRVNQNDVTIMSIMRCAYPGESDAERSAYNVLDFVRSRPMDPCERASLLAEFEAQIRTRYSR